MIISREYERVNCLGQNLVIQSQPVIKFEKGDLGWDAFGLELMFKLICLNNLMDYKEREWTLSELRWALPKI